ncbi:hypothetical protein QIW49_03635 [Francisellaceae bacterium CB300]
MSGLNILLSSICSILGLIFVFRIVKFKKDAWTIYLLATLVGTFNFVFYNDMISLDIILTSIFANTHDIVLSSIGIFIFYTKGVKVKTIRNKKQLINILPFMLFVTIAIVIWQSIYLKLFMNINFSSYLFPNILGVIAFVGSALLIRGFVLGFLLSAVFELYMAVQYVGFNSSFLIFNMLIHIISFIVFTITYIKVRKVSYS